MAAPPPVVNGSTPFSAQYVNRFWDQTRDLLEVAGVSASGVPDTALNSDVLTATLRIISQAGRRADAGRFDLRACAPINRFGAHRSAQLVGDLVEDSERIGSIAMSGDGQILFALRGGDLVRAYRLREPGLLDSISEGSVDEYAIDPARPPLGTATSLTFGRGGELAILCFSDGRFVTYGLSAPWALSRNVDSRVVRQPELPPEDGAILDLTWSADGHVALAVTKRSVLTLALTSPWIMQSANVISQASRTISSFSEYRGIAVSPDGLRYCLSGRRVNVGLNRSLQQFRLSEPWNLDTAELDTELEVDAGIAASVEGIAWRPDGGALLCAMGLRQAVQLDAVAVQP